MVGPIHQTPLCPNSDNGTFVMMSEASAVTVVDAVAGVAASVYAGFVNVLGVQSSRKNPIVFAMGGSTAGVIGTTGGVTGGGAGGVGVDGSFFLQEIANTNSATMNDRRIRSFGKCMKSV